MALIPTGLVAASLVSACAAPSSETAERSSLFRPEVALAAVPDDRTMLQATDAAGCGLDGAAAGRPSHDRAVGAKLAVAQFGREAVALMADADGRQLRRLSLAR